MILRIKVCLKQLSILGKEFKWIKPSICPGCEISALWGHGFVLKAFAEFFEKLWLKRYRCPGCHIILTLHPEGFWPRFQSSIHDIYKILYYQRTQLQWPRDCPRQRARQWMRRFISFLLMQNGRNTDPASFADYLQDFYQRQINFCGK